MIITFRIYYHISYPEKTDVTSLSLSKNGETPSDYRLSFLKVVFVMIFYLCI